MAGFITDPLTRAMIDAELVLIDPRFLIEPDPPEREVSMTEGQWLACDSPGKMLYGPGGRKVVVGERRMKLWVEACQSKANARIDWNPIVFSPTVAAASTRWAASNEWDATCPLAYRAAALRDIVGNPWRPVAFLRPGDTLKMTLDYRLVPAGEGDRVAATVLSTGGATMRVRPAYADPLSPATWPLWRPDYLTPQVLDLAAAAHESPRPDGTLDPFRLALLSDALEEAGCDDAAALDHLRSPGPHVRGCHVLDLLLGKE